jgi:hypothetical protein
MLDDMKPTYKQIHDFMQEERSLLQADESNYFALVFGEISKYYEYLTIVWPRYREISKVCIDDARKILTRQMAEPSGSSRPLTEAELHKFEISRERLTLLYLELESIFIFTSILLDRIAAATQYYFGQSSRQWRSFKAMKDYFAGYCQNKGLPAPSSEMLEVIRWLHKNVCEFRHLLVVHKHENDYQVRLSYGIGFGNGEDGESYFNLGLTYPQGNEVPVVSEKPQNILSKLNFFIELWLTYLKANRTKRNLSRNA